MKKVRSPKPQQMAFPFETRILDADMAKEFIEQVAKKLPARETSHHEMATGEYEVTATRRAWEKWTA